MLLPIRRSLASLVCVIAVHRGTAQSPPRFVPVPEMRIDGTAHDLSELRGFAVSARGEIQLPLNQDHVVRYFDAAGKPLATFGRKGAGPGEFEGVGITGWIADTSWAYDYQLRRTVYLTPAHTLLRTVPMPVGITCRRTQADCPVTSMVFANRWYPGGRLLVHASLPESPNRESWRPASRAGYSPLFLISADGVFEGVGGWRLPLSPGCSVGQENAKGSWGVGVPYCATPVYVVSADGQRMANVKMANDGGARSSFTVIVDSIAGPTLFTKTVAYSPVSVSRRASDSVMALIIKHAQNPEQARIIRSMKIPAFYPPVRQVIIGRDRSIWLEQWTGKQGHEWLVLDARGNQVGAVSLPNGVEMREADFGAKQMWGIETDSNEVESVVRWQLRRGQ